MIISNEQKPIERVMDNAFSKLRSKVDADTVIGKPLVLEDGTGILPVSRVTMGFLTGGGEYSDISGKSPEFPFAGGSGIGAAVTPVGFLVMRGKDWKILHIGDRTLYDKVLSMIPEALEALADAIAKSK